MLPQGYRKFIISMEVTTLQMLKETCRHKDAAGIIKCHNCHKGTAEIIQVPQMLQKPKPLKAPGSWYCQYQCRHY